ncbi:MAG: hypothetical protein J6T10_21215 [Methanobrevibacter sp.]|nr:hypothetical protein [Methanobrevibacter sp.]
MDNNAENELDIIGTYRPKFKDKNGNMQELPLDATTVKGIDVTNTANLINGAGFITTPIPEAPKSNGVWKLICQITNGIQNYRWVADTDLDWHLLKLDSTWPLQ